MSERNQTINSADELHKSGKYPADFNVRNNPRPTALTGKKLTEYNLLERFRGMWSGELSSNYWLLQ